MSFYKIQFNCEASKRHWMKQANWTSDCYEIKEELPASLVFQSDTFPNFEMVKEDAFVYDAFPCCEDGERV
jgi:hypothetical protein